MNKRIILPAMILLLAGMTGIITEATAKIWRTNGAAATAAASMIEEKRTTAVVNRPHGGVFSTAALYRLSGIVIN